jgi:hypothetical protein
MGIFIERDIGELYLDCVIMTRDGDYCGKVVRLAKEAKRRRFTYGVRPKLHLVLPDVEYRIGVIVDRNKRQIIITMIHANHAVFLHYVRDGGDYVLKWVDVLNVDVAAMYNGPPP